MASAGKEPNWEPTSIVNPDHLEQLVGSPPPSSAAVEDILRKARNLQGLTLEEAASLLNLEDEHLLIWKGLVKPL